MDHKVIVNGASCTADSPWMTWADLMEYKYQCASINLGQRGLGNESIITKALHTAYQTENPIIILMLTSIDKWDWYTEDQNIITQLQKEKHKPYSIVDQTLGTYWSTGIWFPTLKEHYKQKYYSQTHMVLNTIKHIDWFVKTCTQQQWPFLLLTDSRIFAYTEVELDNNFYEVKTYAFDRLINDVTGPFYKQIKKHIDTQSMIHHGDERGMPVIHSKYKAHPGTAVHYEYAKNKLFPFIDQYLPTTSLQIEDLVASEQKIWDSTNR